MPDEPEVHGLLALMQIHHARREARFSGQELVLLEDQDSSLWDAQEIAAGRTALQRALALRARARAVRAAGRDRLAPGRRANRLERGRRAVPPARADHALARGRSSTARSPSRRPGQPSRRSRSSIASTSTTTTTCTPRAVSCCGASAGPMRHAKRSNARLPSPAQSASGASSRAGSPSCRAPPGQQPVVAHPSRHGNRRYNWPANGQQGHLVNLSAPDSC